LITIPVSDVENGQCSAFLLLMKNSILLRSNHLVNEEEDPFGIVPEPIEMYDNLNQDLLKG